MGVQPHSWEPRLPPPARPVPAREQSSKPPFERCDCHRETLPRMLRSSSSWEEDAEEPAQQLGCKAVWWHHCWWMEGTLHQQRVWAPSSGDARHGMAQRRSSSASVLQIPFHRNSLYPLALELSQGIHPPQVACPIKQEGRVPPEPEPRSEVAVPAQQGPARRAAFGRAGCAVGVPDT